MKRCSIVFAAVLAIGGALSPLSAQKAPPPATQHPQPATTPTTGAKVPPTPATSTRVTPTTVAPTPAASQPAAPQPSVTQPAASQPTVTQPAAAAPASAPPPAPVTPQAVRPSANASAGTYTAGLAMPPYTGTTTAEAWEYTAHLGRLLDSTIVTLVGTFRNTSGQPMFGASGPTTLSHREQDRWARCRDLYWDLSTYAAAVGGLKGSLGPDAALERAIAELDSAFTRSVATSECDNVASMIAAPDRWTPWQDQYENAARHFYRDFYSQVRDVHEKDRALMIELNRFLPAARRAPPPPGLPQNPPYAGAAPS